MLDEFSENEIAGSKWQILKILSKSPQTPKQLAEKLGTTIANMSQQLKLLEAYGFLKKTRADKGPNSRKLKDLRVMYTLVKGKIWLTSIAPGNVKKKELKLTPDTSLMINLLLSDYKEEIPFILNFFINSNLVEHIDGAYYLRSDNQEIHILVVTKKLEHFRENKSYIKIKHKNEDRTIRFWSHTIQEIREGLIKKEEYFIDLTSQTTPLYEKEHIDFNIS
ncbi:MAG: winged helix-turn-helix domain-containing protein [Candidatus Woesearchaeota archaeon]|jgi:DNA-binding MarR family transcriptional regulator